MSLVLAMAHSAALAGSAENSRTLKVAVAQTRNLDHDYEGSRASAEKLVAEAAAKGAQLVLLPEFALIGYRYSDDSWEMAEPLEGPTVKWMRELCRRYNIYLATCIMEVSGNDFYDTMVLVGPGEGELWYHRKIEPAQLESWFFKPGGINPSVFETPLGRIGMAICFDTSKTHTVQGLLEGNPDFVLMAFSAPKTPESLGSNRNLSIEMELSAPARFARILGVPVVRSEKTGLFNSPLPGLPGASMREDFIAHSSIVDAEGKMVAELGEEEAVLVAEIMIPANPVRHPELIPAGRWLSPYNGLVRWWSDQTLKLGILRYTHSRARKAAVAQAKQKYSLE